MDFWKRCLDKLAAELPEQQFSTWVMPLQVEEGADELVLYAPNQFVLNWVRDHYLELIEYFLGEVSAGAGPRVKLMVGSRPEATQRAMAVAEPKRATDAETIQNRGGLNPDFTFSAFVEGKSNQVARAASIQIGGNPGRAYNPLFIYGGVGLGKTHLMHAVGNAIFAKNPRTRALYMHSETFVSEMVKALQHGTIDAFKRRMRSVNALLIDDVQFFAGKERSQEEFFHTFNALFESQQQIVLSSDRFPKDVEGLEDRLKSRFGWGLTVQIEPPDLETRVAILNSKAEQLFGIELPREVSFFVGQRVRSNIRELEGALRRIVAHAQITGRPIGLSFAKEALRDLIASHDRQVTIGNIQKTVSEYFKIRTTDLSSAKRTRSIARPRQVAMALAKELTTHSLPEIGEAFGGRDHTTVLYATRKVAELRETDQRIAEDYENLLRTLST